MVFCSLQEFVFHVCISHHGFSDEVIVGITIGFQSRVDVGTGFCEAT
jgi:hypothetical protein